MRKSSLSLRPTHLGRHAPEPDRDHELARELRARRQAERAALHDLQPVVDEADRGGGERRAEHREARGVGVGRGSGTGPPIAMNTTRPPIVGVPALTWCSAGPPRGCAGRTRAAQELDELRARGRSRSAARPARDQDLAQASGQLRERRARGPTDARALDQHDVAGAASSVEQRAGLLGRRRRRESRRRTPRAIRSAALRRPRSARRSRARRRARRSRGGSARRPGRARAMSPSTATAAARPGLSARWSRAARIDMGLAL